MQVYMCILTCTVCRCLYVHFSGDVWCVHTMCTCIWCNLFAQCTTDVEESYLNSVAVIYFDCLKLLTFCLRCAIAKIQGWFCACG